MTFTVPTIITLMAWGTWRPGSTSEGSYQQKGGESPFPRRKSMSPPHDQHLLYRFYRQGSS